MLNKRLISAALTCLLLSGSVLALAGCMDRDDNDNKVKQSSEHTQHAQNLPQGDRDNRVDVANQAADKIVQLGTVKSANVLVMRRSAYVAATVDSNQSLSRELEDQIAAQVRGTDANIQNVYVSTNPEFVDRVNRYVTDVNQGRPVSGFFQEFTQIISRIFPNAR